MIDGEDSITSAWQTAMQAAQEYGDIVSALNGINNDIANEQQGILDQQQEDAEISASNIKICLVRLVIRLLVL